MKKRKRDLKNEQKKRRGAERLSEKRIKKDSLLQPDYLDILWIKPSRFWQMKLRKKCQKRVRKDNFAKTDQVFMLVPSKFRYFLATDWQRSCNIRWIKSYFYNIKTLLMNCFQNWKEQSVRFFSFKINWFGNIAYQESLFGCSVGFGYRLNCWWS